MNKLFILATIFLTVNLFARDAMLSKVQKNMSEEKTLELIKKIEKTSNQNKNFYLGILYHNLASKNYKAEYITKALTLCAQEYQKNKNVLALAYQGSALTLQASLDNQNKKFIESAKNIEKGFELIDLAIYKKPNLVGLHILRLVNGVAVAEASPFKDRFKIVKKDIAFLTKIYSKLSNRLKAIYHFNYGKIDMHEKNIDKAIKNFKKVKQLVPGSEIAKATQKKLWELEE